MSRESQGECGVMEGLLQTSITGLHALVGRIQVRTGLSFNRRPAACTQYLSPLVLHNLKYGSSLMSGSSST